MSVQGTDELQELFHTAREVKETIYGLRIVLFAPLYISNLCSNECVYCAFRKSNHGLPRRVLTQEEIRQEVLSLVKQGHKRILLVAGESLPQEGISYILKSIETIYQSTYGRGEIRRVNVNIAPLSVEDFRELKRSGIGTYQLFQETYHPAVYARYHHRGPKKDYLWRLTAMDRAMQAGIDDVGVGVLFGLYDWRFEMLALMQHIRHLENEFGVGPHTISVPRMEPADGAEIASNPPYPVSDTDFLKLIAILRLAVPYTGMIMSTRETAQVRRETLALGVSQISAGSRTNPGGYTQQPEESGSQFSLGDHRSLEEVVQDLFAAGFIPSFCTACYRLGRTGQDFMDLAKPGEIKHHCDPNAYSTFQEYLEDYASPQTRQCGALKISEWLAQMEPVPRRIAQQLVKEVENGKRDVFV
jgi:2-iminoacetate synthase